MKKKIYIVLIIILIILFTNIVVTCIVTLNTNKEPINQTTKEQQIKYKGISTTIYRYTTKLNIENNLNKFENINSSVSLCVMEYINKPTDNVITSIPNWQFKMDTFMKIANEKNIKVEMLKPHIGTYSGGDGFSRRNYNPENKELFFSNWQSILLKYANYCDLHNIPLLAIECEMSQLTTEKYYLNWEKIINTIKKKYPKLKITTAFTSSQLKNEIISKKKGLKSILDLVDYIGYNFYPTLQKDDLNKIAIQYNNTFNNVFTLWHKKILITESGSTSWSNVDSNKLYPIYIPKEKGIPYNFTNQHIF
ncbi:glycoside hydrolase family 113 [Clostridium arbusti]|uniref:glycoside hydrolase family 113 n=1 Tax=Clostridium arbusti TaxID=1137848 RepID=UPI0002880764|nr:hypothetical protein [Clostridium arbusti]